VDLDSFKIVYVAPMKALVQEVVLNFGKRLEKYGMTVRELSGDQSLTRTQINETQVRACVWCARTHGRPLMDRWWLCLGGSAHG
jgi:hypothetical protein